MKQAIQDIRDTGKFSHLVVCLDAEQLSIQERAGKVQQALAEWQSDFPELHLNQVTFEIIVHNRCIETWLLGNREIVPENPRNQDLINFLGLYDVRVKDPERMDLFNNFRHHAKQHYAYFRAFKAEETFDEHSRSYFESMVSRITDMPTHLQTFQSFLTFCRRLGAAV